MNILILNWRDIKNPESGGAEILTHEIAKGLVKMGHQVTLMSSFFKNAHEEEVLDGVKIIREGHTNFRFLFSSVHFRAFKYYLKNKNGIDLVVDEIHGMPFFTPLYVGKKSVVLICEVASDLWIKMFGPFLGFFGMLLEKFYFRFIYKNTSFMTISNSTKMELLKEGINSRNITILPIGVTIPRKIIKKKKEKNPTLIFAGRLLKSKGIEDAIFSLKILSEDLPKLKLWIIGRGNEEYLQELKNLVKKEKLEKKIIFWGFVSNSKKFELMARAWILIFPSIKEGWGLTVPEAASQGTPTIAYDVCGLRDVVVEGVNGFKVEKNNTSELARKILELIRNKSLYKKLQISSKKSSLIYNWINTVKAVSEVIE